MVCRLGEMRCGWQVVKSILLLKRLRLRYLSSKFPDQFPNYVYLQYKLIVGN